MVVFVDPTFDRFSRTGIKRAGAAMIDQRRCGLRCGLDAIGGKQQIDDDRK